MGSFDPQRKQVMWAGRGAFPLWTGEKTEARGVVSGPRAWASGGRGARSGLLTRLQRNAAPLKPFHGKYPQLGGKAPSFSKYLTLGLSSYCAITQSHTPGATHIRGHTTTTITTKTQSS